MKRLFNSFGQLIVVILLITLMLVLVLVFQWWRGSLGVDNIAGSSISAYPNPTSFELVPTKSLLSPYPPPEGSSTVPTVQISPHSRSTLVPIPPPGWPTNQPWPPDKTMITPLPTKIFKQFPTPDLQLSRAEDFTTTFQLIFPYYPKADNNPELWAAQLDSRSQQWETSPLSIELDMPVPVAGPDPGPILVDLHLSPDSRWLVADFAYRGSQLVDLHTGQSHGLSDNLPSPYWRFIAWSPGDALTLLAAGAEIPVTNVMKVDVETGKVEQVSLVEQGVLGDANLAGIAYSPDGQNMAMAIVYPPTVGVREHWSAAVCLENCAKGKLAEIKGGAAFVDHSLRWSPNGEKLAWVVEVMNEDGGLETQLWIADLTSGSSREIAVLGNPGKNLYPPVWSADGTMIATIKNGVDQQEGQNIYLFNVISGEEKQLTELSGSHLSHL